MNKNSIKRSTRIKKTKRKKCRRFAKVFTNNDKSFTNLNASQFVRNKHDMDRIELYYSGSRCICLQHEEYIYHIKLAFVGIPYRIITHFKLTDIIHTV